jgi:hypothetical protein
MDLTTLLLLGLGGYVIYNALNQGNQAAQQSQAPTQTGGAQVPVLTPQPTSGQQAPGAPIVSATPSGSTGIPVSAYVPPPAAPQIPPAAPSVAQQTIITGDTVQGAIDEANALADRMTALGITPEMLAVFSAWTVARNTPPASFNQSWPTIDEWAAQNGWSTAQAYAASNYLMQLHSMGA